MTQQDFLRLSKVKKMPEKAQPKAGKAATAAVEQAVSKRLKAFYDDIANQDVPKHLLELLDKLDASSDPETSKQA